jgi:hypothetical protein
MSETTNETAEQALAGGNNSAAAQSFGDDLPKSLERDPMYLMVYLGGIAVYGVLIGAFLL